MLRAAGGHLRQVGNGEHLVLPPQRAQGAADGFGHAAADAAVYFVKNQGGNLGVLAGSYLQSQADAGQFAAGSDFVQRPQGAALVGGYLKLHLIQPVCLRFARNELNVETCAAHGKLLHMLGGFFGQFGGGLLPLGRQLARGLLIGSFGQSHLFAQGFDVGGGFGIGQILL